MAQAAYKSHTGALFILAMYTFCWVKIAGEPSLRTFDDYLEAIYQRHYFADDFASTQAALQEAYAHPIHLNKAKPEELAALGILSDTQLEAYFKHVTTTGPLYSKYELQAIPHFDLATISLLLPFIDVPEQSTTTLSPLLRIQAPSQRNCLLFCYKQKFETIHPFKAKKATSPLGKPHQYTSQIFLYPAPEWQLGLVARKQAGENFTWDHATNRYGFNLWSMFLLKNYPKKHTKVILGDYQVGYGQGLLLNCGCPIYTSADIIALFRSNNIGIVPYKGIQRIGLRGIASTIRLTPWTCTGFYSNHNLDAHLDLDPTGHPYAKHIDTQGIYNTPYKLDKKGNLNRQSIGCTALYSGDRQQREIGLNLLYIHYGLPLMFPKIWESDTPFYGQNSLSSSLFYRFLYKNILLFGEGAVNFPQAQRLAQWACIQGGIISLTCYISLSTAAYYYGGAFYSPYGAGFKQYTSSNTNEKGIYGGIKCSPLAHWQLLTQGHWFATLHPKRHLKTASHGYRINTRSCWIPVSYTHLTLPTIA